MASRTVTFDCDNVVITSGVSVDKESSDNFYTITTSEAESFVTSDEDDPEFIQMALENAFTCSPLKCKDPAEMSSNLLLDKD